MPWKEKRLSSWEEFQTLASQFADTKSAMQYSYLFRGQTNSAWRLTPSLHRALKAGTSAPDAIDIERRVQMEFFSQVHLHVDPALLNFGQKDLWERWALMQHYGAPTRLLDWTLSPYVGAYFAVEDGWDSDGAIWVFHAYELMEHAIATIDPEDRGRLSDSIQPNAPPTMAIHQSQNRSARIVAQQGIFTVCRNILGEQYDLIEAACSERPEEVEYNYGKLIIPMNLKPTFLHHLYSMNVTANSLFPGADGLGRSMRELARLTAHFPISKRHDKT